MAPSTRSAFGTLSTVLCLAAISPAHAQDEGLDRASFLKGDFLVLWSAEGGAALTYRGIPVFTGGPGEFVVHQRWQEVFYRSGSGDATAQVEEGAAETVLTVSAQSEHFRYAKRIVVGPGPDFSVTYEYELLEPDAAELQILFGLGKQWIDGSTYRIFANGEERRGELAVPDVGRTDPWGGATEQAFTTDHGTASIGCDVGLNLYCDAPGGHLWWAQALEKGQIYRHTIDVAIEPGPASDTGLVLSGLDWSRVVRDGVARFTIDLARAADGPERIIAQALRASGSTQGAGEPVTVGLTETAASIECQAPVDGKGLTAFAVALSSEDGEEIIRLGPLHVDARPWLSVMPRLSLYTHEADGEIVATLADAEDRDGLSLVVSGEGFDEVTQDVTGEREIVPISLDGLPDGLTEVTCALVRGDEQLAELTTQLTKAPPQANEVKIDNLTRGLIVDGLPMIPFGFYTYFPIKEGIVEEEVALGFNLFSPYHGGPLEPISEYMDRCAAVGMKVNYHLMWANNPAMTEEDWQRLREEIEAFRDHPALLSWYIADEPSADRVAHLEAVNALVKGLDPYHPVTVVFYRGAEHAKMFTGTMDIVMGDPYPIPNSPVTYVSDMSDSLNDAFDFGKPLWIVPQCFGGHEHWRREPTAQEQRVMTYLSLVHGARGIQYFIRSPRSSFPKSPVMWSECGTLALETAELTPALLSEEPQPEVTSSAPAVHVSAHLDRGIITVLAVNTENRPLPLRIELPGVAFSGEADVLFEDRKVEVDAGAIVEPIDAFDTRAYAIPVGPLPEDDLEVDPANMSTNPSWEWMPSVGTPAGCYAGIPYAATAFVDPRVARHGRHSLRMTAPSDEATPSISPYWVPLTGGREYRISIWAKGKSDGVKLSLSLSGVGEAEFELTTEWREYEILGTPEDDIGRAGIGLGLASAGTAWMDVLQIVPVE